jgi:hypothetical protein
LAAHYGKVDIRITAKADTNAMADELISGVEQTIRQKLGRVIYGADEETLEEVVLTALAKKGWKLAVLEINTGGELTRLLSAKGSEIFISGKILTGLADGQTLNSSLADEMKTHQADVAIGLAARAVTGKSEVDLILVTPQDQKTETRGYGGHPKNVPTWGANSALELLRATLQ